MCKLHWNLTFQLCDIAVRAIAMLGLLECGEEVKICRCLELCYFIDRSLDLWDEANRHSYKSTAFWKLTSQEREGIEFDSFAVEYPDEFDMPKDVVAFCVWIPEKPFLDITAAVSLATPVLVPNQVLSGSVFNPGLS
jgi:hypothetical protein